MQELRFSNYKLFRLTQSGLGVKDLILSPSTDEQAFCRAWAIVLGREFDGDAEKFIDALTGRNKILELNDTLISALERDGVLKSDSDAKADSKGG